MSPPTDRVQMWNRRCVAAAAIGIAACAASAAWSVRASRSVDPKLPSAHIAAPANDAPAPGPAPLDMQGFAKLLSVPPPPVPAAQDPKAVAESSRFSLLGISEGPNGLMAAVHDRSDDRVHFVREGDALGRATVRRVAPREVELAGAGGSPTGDATLRLISPRPPGSMPSTQPATAPSNASAAKGSA